MSKKEPKTVRVGKKTVEVSDEVYACLRKTNRKIRYFTKDLKEEQIVVEESTVTFIPAREDSYDWLDMDNDGFAAEQRSVEEILIAAEMLSHAVSHLSDDQKWIIQKIFFERVSEEEIAESLGITQQAVSGRKTRALRKIENKIIFEKGGCENLVSTAT